MLPGMSALCNEPQPLWRSSRYSKRTRTTYAARSKVVNFLAKRKPRPLCVGVFLYNFFVREILEIFKGLDADSDVLKKMGSAEMQREIERRVLPLANKVKMSTDIEYTNLDMDREDLKMLIDDVLKEVHRGTHSKRDNH